MIWIKQLTRLKKNQQKRKRKGCFLFPIQSVFQSSSLYRCTPCCTSWLTGSLELGISSRKQWLQCRRALPEKDMAMKLYGLPAKNILPQSAWNCTSTPAQRALHCDEVQTNTPRCKWDTGKIRWEGLFLFCIPNKAMCMFKSRSRQYIFTTGEVSISISTLPLHRTFFCHFRYAHASRITAMKA